MAPISALGFTTVERELRDLGTRIARIRLSRNLTQASLARETGASVRSIKRLEAGENVSLDTLIRVLAALNLGDRLAAALPDPDVRPVERIRHEGHERQRARERNAVQKATEWAWGEDEE
ncbi:helix-turn-helix domain-containing protein [Brucella anthropi]|uniref:helix-turn-helix domain-containing protein n=1 Tax=Brucella anthropi TaxID=529 RepID=UPI0021584E99|nr:helix-turn-helix transcriptional regulator [Brucella anthropi]MCR8493419.1 helix-turn-helix domain-containing protein [Brucella anthropi]